MLKKRKGSKLEKKKRKPKLLIDTCIALDCIFNRREKSKEVLDIALKHKWEINMSIFGGMELLDTIQEREYVNKKFLIEKWSLKDIFNSRREQDLGSKDFAKINQQIDDFLNKYKVILRPIKEDAHWKLSFRLAKNSNINATDILHLITAWAANCDLLLTNDKPFIREAKKSLKTEKLGNGKPVWTKLRICAPEYFKRTLTQIGFNMVYVRELPPPIKKRYGTEKLQLTEKELWSAPKIKEEKK